MIEHEYFDWLQTIKPNLVLLKMGGLWPKTTYKLDVYCIWAIFWLGGFLFLDAFFQAINMYYTLDDLEVLTNSFFTFLTKINGIFKCYNLVAKNQELKRLMGILNSDLFQPRNAYQRQLVQPSLKSWTTMFIVLWTPCVSVLILYAVFPLFYVANHVLPQFAWNAYDVTASPFTFWPAYVHQAFSLTACGCPNVGIDTIIGGLNMYAGAQYDLLCDNLKKIHLAENKDKELVRCVRHHREIVKFAKDINAFCNWIILLQFFVSLLTMAVVMFQLSLVPMSTFAFWMMLFYVITLMIQLMVYCWFGNEVELKSHRIIYAAFESDWTSFSQKTKKSLLFFMLASEKPLKVSALNIFDLTLENYMKIVKSSFSYYALLQQLNTA